MSSSLPILTLPRKGVGMNCSTSRLVSSLSIIVGSVARLTMLMMSLLFFDSIRFSWLNCFDMRCISFCFTSGCLFGVVTLKSGVYFLYMSLAYLFGFPSLCKRLPTRFLNRSFTNSESRIDSVFYASFASSLYSLLTFSFKRRSSRFLLASISMSLILSDVFDRCKNFTYQRSCLTALSIWKGYLLSSSLIMRLFL